MFYQKKPMRIAIIQNMSYVYKKNVTHDKNQKLIYFSFRGEASKVNEFFKNFRLCDTKPLLKPSFDNKNVIIGLYLTRPDNNQTIKAKKLRS